MQDLIAEVRRLINDPLGAQFDDAAVQDELDLNRDDVNYLELRVKPHITEAAPSHYEWLEYYAPLTHWEADALIFGYIAPSAYADLTAGGVVSAVDYLVGHWTLTSTIYPPVFIRGKTYDVHMAASNLLAQWASKEVLNFDASQMGTHASRSQKYKMLMEQSAQMAARRRPRDIEIARRDVTPRWGQRTPQGQPAR
jgi:hypothetical protein